MDGRGDPPDLLDEALADYAIRRIGPNVRALLICVKEAAEIAPALRQLSERIDELMFQVESKTFALACLISSREEALGEAPSLDGVWDEIRAELAKERCKDAEEGGDGEIVG